MKTTFTKETCYVEADNHGNEIEIEYGCTFYVDNNYGADADGNRGTTVTWDEIDYWEAKNCDLTFDNKHEEEYWTSRVEDAINEAMGHLEAEEEYEERDRYEDAQERKAEEKACQA